MKQLERDRIDLLRQKTKLPEKPAPAKGFLVMWVWHTDCGTVLRVRVGSSIIGILTGRVESYSLNARCPVCKKTFEVKFNLEDYNNPLYSEAASMPPPIDNPALLRKIVAEDAQKGGGEK